MTRRGSIYLVVLGTVTIVALLGTAGVLAQTRQRERAGASLESGRAAALARSAIELGLQRVMEDENWRTSPGGGVWYADAAPTGDARDGTLTLTVTGPGGGALGTGDDDPFELVAVGVAGDAARSVRLEFEQQSTATPLDCLDVVAAIGNDALLEFNAVVAGSGVLSANGSINADTSFVSADVEAVGSIDGSFYSGAKGSLKSERAIPIASDVLAAYMALNPVVISRASLPQSGGVRYMESVVLTPTHNPYGAGATHPDGIYLINLNDNAIVIRNVRVRGTLILIMPQEGASAIEDSVSFEPAIDGYPSLIVTEKAFELATSSQPLDEASLGVNFNPSGAEVDADADSDMTDVYPSQLSGIVYVEKDVLLRMGTQVTIEGHLVTVGKLMAGIGSQLTLTDDSDSRSSPPPAFSAGGGTTTLTMQPWRRGLD